MFAPDGTYLGEVRRPEGLSFRGVFVDGDACWALVEDEYGAVIVKRYRMVISGAVVSLATRSSPLPTDDTSR